MNTPAHRPALVTACLVSLGLGSAAAVETELQIGPDDLIFSAELQNKDYDQGVVRTNEAIVRLNATVRYWDIGLQIGGAVALGGDDRQTYPVSTGEMTSSRISLDYLIEMKGAHGFQILPHFTWISYPNLPDVPYKDTQAYLGVDGWYNLPWEGVEVGTSVDYNAFYDSIEDSSGVRGGLSNHMLRGAIALREHKQFAPVDLFFYQVLNYGNGEYKNFLLGENETGFTTLDLGVKYTAPFYLEEFWMVTRFEIHTWLEGDDRARLKSAGKDRSEVVLGIGFEWRPK